MDNNKEPVFVQVERSYIEELEKKAENYEYSRGYYDGFTKAFDVAIEIIQELRNG